MGDGRIFTKKNTAPLSLIKAYRMSLISAGFISLESTFNYLKALVLIFSKTLNSQINIAANFRPLAGWGLARQIFVVGTLLSGNRYIDIFFDRPRFSLDNTVYDRPISTDRQTAR
jgi:hypothetical protein